LELTKDLIFRNKNQTDTYLFVRSISCVGWQSPLLNCYIIWSVYMTLLYCKASESIRQNTQWTLMVET